MDDFWDNGIFADTKLDNYLQGRPLDGDQFKSVRSLADSVREANALDLPVEAGTRVRFISNVGSVLSYDSVPADGVDGTVVTVKTGAGNTTAMDGRVFVLWDDGKFRGIMAEHLRRAGVTSKRAQAYRMVVSDLGDLSAFFAPTSEGSGDELVHKSTQDLWAFRKDGEQYVIERLFGDNGQPLKV